MAGRPISNAFRDAYPLDLVSAIDLVNRHVDCLSIAYCFCSFAVAYFHGFGTVPVSDEDCNGVVFSVTDFNCDALLDVDCNRAVSNVHCLVVSEPDAVDDDFIDSNAHTNSDSLSDAVTDAF